MLNRYSWGLEHVSEPGFGRIKLEHTIIDWRKIQDYYSYDDEIKLNPQAGSQWDGLRHFGHTETGLYYNNVHHDDLLATDRIGIDRKLIVATGCLELIDPQIGVNAVASSAEAYSWTTLDMPNATVSNTMPCPVTA